MRNPLSWRIIVYAVLIAGTIAFAFPFIWLISTSLKLDRELFSGQLDLLPQAPKPRIQSPYYDERQFEGVDTSQPQYDLLAPLIRKKIDKAASLMRQASSEMDLSVLVTRGVFDFLYHRAPGSIWNGPDEALQSFAEAELTPDRVAQIASRARRELGVGPLRVRSDDLQDVEIAPQVSPAKRWNSGSLVDHTESGLAYAAVEYNFASTDRVELETMFELPFDAREIHRVQLRLRPDDTWHELHMTLDAGGVRYGAARGFPLADWQWTTLTWQKPSADDRSTKLRSWILLKELERSSQFDQGPRTARLKLEIRKATPATAMFAKARHNYRRVLEQIPFWRYVRVSVLLVVLNIVLTLFASSLVAYAFARIQWPGRDFAFILLLGTMMIPAQVTMIPNFLIWKHLGAYNTLTPLWLGAAFGNAFFIFLMRQFLRGVPRDLEDAARIDGCGFLRTYWHVMLPLVKPSLAAIAIFTFIGTWNDFLGPLIYIADQRLYPLAFGLYAFALHVNSNPVLTMSASLLMTIPVILVFFAAQRYFIQGITLTGMKA